MIYPDKVAVEAHFVDRGSRNWGEEELRVLLAGEIHSRCSELADYKRVRNFLIRDEEFPKTATRKIQRFKLVL
jgi:long-chain acyl-CoA synthetase